MCGSWQDASFMQPGLPRKHHFIPQFYLRRWQKSDGRVQYFRRIRDTVKTYRKYPSEIGYHEDLYTWQGKSHEVICLESDFFSQIDGQSATAIAEILRRKGIPKESSFRSAIVRFLLSLMHRTPYQISSYRAAFDTLWRRPDEVVKQKYDAIRHDGYPEDVVDFILAKDPDAIERAFMRQLPASVGHRRLGQFLVNLHWDLRVCSTSQHDFIIGDSPVVWSNGVDKPDGHCCIALAPDAMLLISRNEDIRRQILHLSDNQLVRAYNKLTVRGSRLFAIAKDDRQRSFIEKHLGKSPTESWPERLEVELGEEPL